MYHYSPSCEFKEQPKVSQDPIISVQCTTKRVIKPIILLHVTTECFIITQHKSATNNLNCHYTLHISETNINIYYYFPTHQCKNATNMSFDPIISVQGTIISGINPPFIRTKIIKIVICPQNIRAMNNQNFNSFPSYFSNEERKCHYSTLYHCKSPS